MVSGNPVRRPGSGEEGVQVVEALEFGFPSAVPPGADAQDGGAVRPEVTRSGTSIGVKRSRGVAGTEIIAGGYPQNQGRHLSRFVNASDRAEIRGTEKQ